LEKPGLGIDFAGRLHNPVAEIDQRDGVLQFPMPVVSLFFALRYIFLRLHYKFLTEKAGRPED
jgi:hypothetical protein